MAQKKSAGKRNKSSGARKGRAPAGKKRPVRREVGALVCLLLCVFTALGYFTSDGWLIQSMVGLLKGLLGVGYYLMPPALLLCAVILGFHRGRPVALRVTCALLVPLAAGSLAQVIAGSPSYTVSWQMFARGWQDGRGLYGAGALGGALSTVMCGMLTAVGAGIVLGLLLVLLFFGALRVHLSDMAEALRRRERPEYDEEDYIREPKAPKEPRRPAETAEATAAPVRRRPEIDIPLDEETTAAEPKKTAKKGSFFNKVPRVETPEEFLTGVRQERPAAPAPEEPAPEAKDISDAVEVEVEELPAEQPPAAPPAPVVTAEVRSENLGTVRPVPRTPARPSPIPAAPVPAPAPAAGEGEYRFPPLDLLQTGSGVSGDCREETQRNRERLETALSSFGVNSTISNIIRGPSVTRYEMELEAGVKLNKITNLADDIALSLGATGVRIAAIPDKVSTVGIEVPNKTVSTVYLRDIIDSPAFANAKSKLTFAIGKNISGEAVVGNISKLPHMLVAGTTGSGKSVCLNSLILSILYKARPDEVKFIMVDPKMVEFRIYNGIPHLLVPVVTEAKKAAGALQWAVTEMMKRYRLFSESNARDLAGYNKAAGQSGDGEKLPQIVVVIDELADLMMVAAKEVEESICRIAQMGRAAGVHLVIATQSPRADVITGLMKANIPSRIALKVSSALESRIILDAGGSAEKLVGNGDMLYAPIGTSKPLRIQGTWVSDEEREDIIDFIKQSGEAEYNEEVISQIEKAAEEKNTAKAEVQEESSDFDELLPQAVDVVFESGQASVSLLQRRLKLGYSRAARIVDQMEEIGVVGPFEGSKPRQLLITRTQWQEMQMLHGTAPLEAPAGADGYAAQNMTSADDLFDSGE